MNSLQQLMVAYLGGREGVEASLNARSHTYHFTPLCCLRIRLARSNFFIRVRRHVSRLDLISLRGVFVGRGDVASLPPPLSFPLSFFTISLLTSWFPSIRLPCRAVRAVMQFVIIKVALAVAVVVLTATHTLRPDAHKPRDLIRSGYFYVKVCAPPSPLCRVCDVCCGQSMLLLLASHLPPCPPTHLLWQAFGGLSVAIAMYGLLLFYSALRDELRPHSPGTAAP